MQLTPPPSPKPPGSCEPCGPEARLGQVLADRIQLTSVLGVGAYGTVYRACDVETGVEYAVKALNKFGLDPRQRRFQDREIRLHYQANHHANVVSMEKILDFPDCTYVVLEYCPEGDLFAKITEEGDYLGKDQKAKTVFLQILDAVRHCHSNGIYHRDLKPENVLVKDNGWTAKLADFGLATQDSITTDFGCGSTFYMSPECQQSNPKPFACYASAPNDVWSLGVILVNLTCGRNPWKRASMDDSTFRAFMRDRNFLQSILPVSDELNLILQRIFEVDPKRRISLDALRNAIVSCRYLSQGPLCSSLPPSPPESPVEKPVDPSFITFGNGLEPIPNLEPLPVQQYPPFSALQFNPPQQPALAPAANLPTPPSSANGSPQQSPYTYQVKPATPPTAACPVFPGQATFVPAFPSWPRCSQFVPNLAQNACWRNVSVF